MVLRRSILMSVLLLGTVLGGVCKAQQIVPDAPAPHATYKGTLWNSVGQGLENSLIMRFARNLKNGHLAPLVSVYSDNNLNFYTNGLGAYADIGAYKIKMTSPVYLNVDNGEIVDGAGNSLGFSYSQYPGGVLKEGFRLDNRVLSIFEKSKEIVIGLQN